MSYNEYSRNAVDILASFMAKKKKFISLGDREGEANEIASAQVLATLALAEAIRESIASLNRRTASDGRPFIGP